VEVWTVYCERLGGWLVDTSNVWTRDVASCIEFPTKAATREAVHEMILNGHTDLWGADVLGIRLR
jgi:hypothetical protein